MGGQGNTIILAVKLLAMCRGSRKQVAHTAGPFKRTKEFLQECLDTIFNQAVGRVVKQRESITKTDMSSTKPSSVVKRVQYAVHEHSRGFDAFYTYRGTTASRYQVGINRILHTKAWPSVLNIPKIRVC